MRNSLILSVLFFSLSLNAGNGAPSGAHYNLNIIGVPPVEELTAPVLLWSL